MAPARSSVRSNSGTGDRRHLVRPVRDGHLAEHQTVLGGPRRDHVQAPGRRIPLGFPTDDTEAIRDRRERGPTRLRRHGPRVADRRRDRPEKRRPVAGTLRGIDPYPRRRGVEALIAELARGHKVIAAVDSGELWGTDLPFEDWLRPGGADHALVVTGGDVSDLSHP